jgi:hypothetical protein
MPMGGVGANEKRYVGAYNELIHEAPGHDASHEMYSPPVELPSENVERKTINHGLPDGRTSMDKSPR